ncbi:MAG: glycerate kinase [Actinomycetales bacterium]|nr:glycerate kinase [Actinomycetales bacterium]
MRVLVAPDCFSGTLSAPQAAEAIARGWALAAPGDEIERCPLSDGGPGFVAVLHEALGGELGSVTVSGPLGEPVPATVLLVEGTAYVESAEAAGLALVAPADRDPTRTSTYGLGELVRAAVGTGARRVVVGVGGTATNDGGAGLIAGLGGWDGSPLRDGGGALDGVTRDALGGLGDLARELAHIDLVAAVDVDVPLLGLHGASAGFAEQKGATPEQAQHLERALGSFAHLAQDVIETDGPPRARHLPLVSTTSDDGHGHSHGGNRGSARLAATPGAGAGGGTGFGLALLGARLVPGARLVTQAVGLAERVARADLVVTGEGKLDWQSLRGKVVQAVAEAGLAAARPTIGLAGQVEMGRREWAAAGLSAVYAVAEDPAQVAAALADPVGTLEARAARLGKNWSH